MSRSVALVTGGSSGIGLAAAEALARTGMDSADAGAYIARIALKPLYAIGFACKCAALAAQLLPCRPKSRLIGQLYAK